MVILSVAAIAVSGAGASATGQLTLQESGHFNLAKSGHYNLATTYELVIIKIMSNAVARAWMCCRVRYREFRVVYIFYFH
jgi:hypothetical protein